jgi:osmotically inducible lipoprotein OsmB
MSISRISRIIQFKQASVFGILALSLLSGCADMSRRDRDTAIGAGAGALGGAVLSNGSGIGTVGGAAVGGVIGNQIGKDKK